MADAWWQALVAQASVDAAVFALRPDYRAALLAVDGLEPSVDPRAAEGLLTRAEEAAQVMLAASPVEDLAHVAAWREAYRAFGAKPQRTRNSLEALLRRAADGLPRVNPLTDVYNAVSVLHQVPLGGEDAAGYLGVPRLLRATGSEAFDTVSGGEPVTEHPDPGEVVWTDAAGVTCRRWNWRQGRRTRLTEQTGTALFVFDALAPLDDAALAAAVDELAEQLTRISPTATTTRRVIGASDGIR